jgi:hypothetical protein
MNMDLAGILNEARRQALLTGKPFTDQETQGLTNAWRNAQMGLSNEQRQNQLGRDQLAQNRWATQAQIDAAQKAQNTQLFGNLINTGGSAVGMDWLKNKQAGTPDNSLISEGWNGAKNLFNNGVDKMGNPFGLGTSAPPPDYTGMGSLNMPAVSASGPAAGAVPGGTADAGAAVPSMIPGAVPDAAPAMGDAGNFAGSLSYNPAGASDVTSSVLAPVSAPATDAAANLGANAAADAAETAVDAPAATGIGASAMMPYGWTLPLASGLHKGVDALFNINEDNTGKVIGDVFDPLKAVSDLCGTWICTATAKHSTMSHAEESIMSKLRRYAQKNHLGWWDSYFKNGTHLVKEIASQETDLPKFYDNIRKILVEPVIKAFDKDPEAAFQIYLFITQTLFKAYMPEFVFKEIE